MGIRKKSKLNSSLGFIPYYLRSPRLNGFIYKKGGSPTYRLELLPELRKLEGVTQSSCSVNACCFSVPRRSTIRAPASESSCVNADSVVVTEQIKWPAMCPGPGGDFVRSLCSMLVLMRDEPENPGGYLSIRAGEEGK